MRSGRGAPAASTSGSNVQVSPPSVLRRSAPVVPTAYAIEGVTNVRSLSRAGVEPTGVHEAAPSVVR